MAYDGYPPFVRGSDTSQAAADRIAAAAGNLRRFVLETLRSIPDGATCDQIEVECLMRHQTASARLRELFLDEFIFDTGERRETRSGRTARVYQLTKLGKKLTDNLTR
jgi:hypothetical protein